MPAIRQVTPSLVWILASLILVLTAPLQATNCRISGSDLIENLHLDQRFCLAFKVTLTWDPAHSSSHSGSKASSVQAPQQYGTGHIQVSVDCSFLYNTAVLLHAGLDVQHLSTYLNMHAILIEQPQLQWFSLLDLSDQM